MKFTAFEKEIFLDQKNFFHELITKNYAADPEKRIRTKSILKPFELTSPFRQRGN